MNLLSISLTKNTPGQTQVYSLRIDRKPDRRFHVAMADHTLKGKLALGTLGDHAELTQALQQAKACIIDRVEAGWSTLMLSLDQSIEPDFVALKVPTGRGRLPTRKHSPAATQPLGSDVAVVNQLVPAGQVIRVFIEPPTTEGLFTVLAADEDDHWVDLSTHLKDLLVDLPLGAGATVIDGIWTGCEFVATDMLTENGRSLAKLPLEIRLSLLKILIGNANGRIDTADFAVTATEKKQQWTDVEWDLGERVWIRPNKPSMSTLDVINEIPHLSKVAA